MKKTTRFVFAAAFLLSAPSALLFTNCKSQMKIKTSPYPVARMDSTVDDYFGTKVTDPYRWMEDENSAETHAWVQAENTVTNDYLAQIPYREQIRKRLTELRNYPKEGIPVKHGDYYFSFRNDGLQNQSVLYRQRSLDTAPEVFLDPNKLSDDGTVALSAVSFSENGKYMAYSLAASGSDWVEIKVMDAVTKTVLPDLVKWVKFSGANWAADSKGFYYSAYDQPAKGSELSGKNQFQKVYYHKLGDPQAADRLIYQDGRHPLRYFSAGESEDGKYLFVSGSEGTHGTEMLYRETAKASAPFRTLFPGFENDYAIVYAKGNRAYIYTNDGAPNYRLGEVNLAEAKPVLKNVIPEHPDNLLQRVSAVGGYLMASYLENAMNAVYQYDMNGKLIRKTSLPGIGTVAGFAGKQDARETFYSITTFTSPAAIYRYTLADGTSSLLRKPEVPYDTDLYTTQQVFFTSKDGTKVPMFIVHRKGMKLDGTHPLYLYGYGGFNISLTPSFNPNNILLLEQGGIYVMVNLRGGGEYGEKWHHAGMLANKQNVFDDFIGAAEYLIKEGYTSSSKLAIAGGSNGGLLVGACEVQRPDLYAVCLPSVGVMDMLRFHKFTIGWGWAVEYGSSDNAEQFRYLYKYSPLHNIKPGTCYPATLVMTADHDDRVVPAHSFKFAATMQAAQACDRPVLIRIDSKAGHGAGKPMSKQIDEATDIYSFLFWNTGTKVKF